MKTLRVIRRSAAVAVATVAVLAGGQGAATADPPAPDPAGAQTDQIIDKYNQT